MAAARLPKNPSQMAGKEIPRLSMAYPPVRFTLGEQVGLNRYRQRTACLRLLAVVPSHILGNRVEVCLRSFSLCCVRVVPR